MSRIECETAEQCQQVALVNEIAFWLVVLAILAFAGWQMYLMHIRPPSVEDLE